jgi:hypothetical protein
MSIYVYLKLEKVVILVSWNDTKSLFLPLIAVPSTNLGIISIVEFLKNMMTKKEKSRFLNEFQIRYILT